MRDMKGKRVSFTLEGINIGYVFFPMNWERTNFNMPKIIV